MNKLQFNGFLKIFLAIPFLFYLYQDLIIGKKVNRIPIIKNQISSNYNSTKSELGSLKDANLISEKDYEDKLRMIKYKNEKDNFMLTQEYKALENLMQNGIFSKEEFDSKVEEIINAKI